MIPRSIHTAGIKQFCSTPRPIKEVHMEVDLKKIKEILDEVVSSEAKCYEILQNLLLRENTKFKSATLERIALILKKFSNTPPMDLLKELETEYGQQNLG